MQIILGRLPFGCAETFLMLKFSIFFLPPNLPCFLLAPTSTRGPTECAIETFVLLFFLFYFTLWKDYWQVTFFWREISTKLWEQPAFQQKNRKLWKGYSSAFAKECFFPLTVKKKGCKDNLFLDTQILVMLAKDRFMPEESVREKTTAAKDNKFVKRFQTLSKLIKV